MIELLPRFNSIHNHSINAKNESENSTVLNNIENIRVNDLFTLGGFYGTALYKNQQKEL